MKSLVQRNLVHELRSDSDLRIKLLSLTRRGRQTLKSTERYITPELKEFEDKVLGARERALAREKLL